ncbi:MAG TPA: YceH family protein [Kiritimatiellia bacterium]|nr:YceH family protein [Kiritimatiellia bacterium]HPS09341.1 YceH family protein [Kiritimatiellia bacterium]
MDTDPATLQLSPLEARILGSLIEKEITTPEYYPLTLNALLAACNQKNNRAPVLTLDEETLARGIYSLQDKRLIESFAGANARALKYRERLTGRIALAPDERAVLCELLLRGAQTPGELRARAARLHPFNTLEEVQATLDRLASRPDGPLLAELPRQPGHKESRVAHLLGDLPPAAEAAPAELPPPDAVRAVMGEAARAAELETRVAALEAEVATLKTLFQTFKSQFE